MLPGGKYDAFTEAIMGYRDHRIPNSLVLIGPAADQLHRRIARPVVVDDMIAIREMVFLTLSYDHRLVDGALGGQFLQYIVEYLENWDTSMELC